MAGKRGSKRGSPATRSTLGNVPTVILLRTPPGQEKYSDVFARFAEPLMDDPPKSPDQLHSRYMVCASAWNLAVFSEEERVVALKELLKQVPFLLRGVMRKQLDILIKRKLALFHEYDWLMNDVVITDVGSDYRLDVEVLLNADAVK